MLFRVTVDVYRETSTEYKYSVWQKYSALTLR
jgi:hypothetical protein